MIILGIDPGSARVGFGLIKKDGSALKLLDSGLLKVSSKEKNSRLVDVADSLDKLIKKHKPDIISLEKLFFMKNIKTAMEVAQARGVLTLIALQNKILLFEYAPSEVKIAVTGFGMADKKAVAKMVAKILNVDKINQLDDATDAIAIAITAAVSYKNNLRI